MIRLPTFLFLCVALTCAQPGQKWVASWTASAHGPYPAGNASAQPDLRFAFPVAAAGARDQTFRLIVQPDLWGRQTRLHFSNVFGTRPVTFDGVFAGLHLGGGAVVAGTNRPVRFGGKASVTVPPGGAVWSDAVDLPFASDPSAVGLAGRKLAVSFHVAGESGPMTWHAKALTTSYVSRPGAGAKGQVEDESAFPFTTTSWYFLDAVDVMAPATTRVVVAFGDSITDGTASTLNGDDRWPNALSRRLHAAYGNRVSVVNAGIGGNQVVGPAEYSAAQPFAGGPSAGQRLERDVIGLSGVSAVIWLEGINDLGAGATVEAIEGGMKEIVGRLRAGDSRTCASSEPRWSPRWAIRAPATAPSRRTASVRRSTSSSAIPACSTGSPISTRRPWIRRPAGCGPSSCRTARLGGRATSCIQIARAIWRWLRQST